MPSWVLAWLHHLQLQGQQPCTRRKLTLAWNSYECHRSLKQWHWPLLACGWVRWCAWPNRPLVFAAEVTISDRMWWSLAASITVAATCTDVTRRVALISCQCTRMFRLFPCKYVCCMYTHHNPHPARPQVQGTWLQGAWTAVILYQTSWSFKARSVSEVRISVDIRSFGCSV